MICHPFDEHFNQYLRTWLASPQNQFDDADEALDALGYELYTRWLNAPASWLDGQTPGLYFEQFDDPAHLLAWMEEYQQQDIPLPATLLERITALPDSVAPLCSLVGREDAPEALRITAIGLLQEIDGEQPLNLYLTLLQNADTEGPLAMALIDALDAMGKDALTPCLALMDKAEYGLQILLLGILSNFPRHSQVVSRAITLFESAENERDQALLAAYLGKLGDPAALSALEAAAENPAIPYLVYVEVRDAVDALGGEEIPLRDFSGDPMYEALRGM